MNDLIPGRPMPSVQPTRLIEMLALTTDVTSLCKAAIDAYSLSITVERDIVSIKAEYAATAQGEQNRHDEAMVELNRRYNEREAQIALIEKMAMQLVGAGQFEVAQAITVQLMNVLSRSPLREVTEHRRG